MKNYDSMSHSFQIGDAVKYGTDEAIMLYNLRFWCDRNWKNEKNIHECSDGKERAWVYNSVSAWSELFPYWTKKQIRRILDSLIEAGIIEKNNFNEMKYDRTNWYTVIEEEDCPNEQIHLPKRTNQLVRKGEPIPDNKPDNKLDELSKDNSIESCDSIFLNRYKKWETCLEILSKLNGIKLPEIRQENLGMFSYEEKKVKWTKVGIEIITYLEKLEYGKFVRECRNQTKIKLKPMSVKEIGNLLKKYIVIFQLALKDEYWPKDKKALKGVKATNFLNTYSKHSKGFSWLLWTMDYEDDIRLLDNECEEVKIDVDSNLRYDYERVLGMSGNKVLYAIQSVFDRVRGIVGTDDFMRMSNSEKFMSEEAVAREYLRFLEGFDSVGPGHVKSDKMWKLFDNFVWKEYGLDLSMSREEALEQIKDAKDVERLSTNKEKSMKEWKSGKKERKVEIYDWAVHYEQFVSGKDKEKKAKDYWEDLKESWLEKYGNVEWVRETIDGVVESGGMISDKDGVLSLLQFG
jgi:hypothetical protein